MRKELDIKINGSDVYILIEGPLKDGKDSAHHMRVTATHGETVRQGALTISGETPDYSKESFEKDVQDFCRRLAAEVVGHERSRLMIIEHLSR